MLWKCSSKDEPLRTKKTEYTGIFISWQPSRSLISLTVAMVPHACFGSVPRSPPYHLCFICGSEYFWDFKEVAILWLFPAMWECELHPSLLLLTSPVDRQGSETGGEVWVYRDRRGINAHQQSMKICGYTGTQNTHTHTHKWGLCSCTSRLTLDTNTLSWTHIHKLTDLHLHRL